MRKLVLNRTSYTPSVILDAETKTFSFKGFSMPEDPVAFYQEVLEWMKDYTKSPIEGAVFTFELDYFNSSSAKSIIQILEMIKKVENDNLIEWIYSGDEEDMDDIQALKCIIGERFVIKKSSQINE